MPRRPPLLRFLRPRLPSAVRRPLGPTRRPPAGVQGVPVGGGTLADLIAPASVEVARDYLRLEHQYARVLAVTGYPRTVVPGWLAPLLNLAEPLEVSLHLAPLESAPVVASLTHQLSALQSSRALADRRGHVDDPERDTAYEDAARLRLALQRGDERVFGVALYAQVRATSTDGLDGAARRVERTLATVLARSRVAHFEQDLGFHSCLPEANDGLRTVHHLDTTSLATMFPFTASGLAMERGVLYGIATDSHTPVIVDPFDASLDNANLAVFAASGAGKSFFTKLLLLRTLLQGTEAIIIDPEGEYRPLCAAVGGQEVRLAPDSEHQLNPFALPPAAGAGDEEGGDPLVEQRRSLLALLELMLAEPGRPLGMRERALLDAALAETYAEAGIHRGVPATYYRPAPLLRDLYAVLARSDEPSARDLALRLARYTDGSLAGLFSGRTNVALDGPLVVFDIRDLDAEARPLGIHLITSYVWGQARRRRRERLLVIDEAWSLLRYERGAQFLEELARRARKHALGLVTITQDVADALGSPQGRAVLTNSACTLLLKQSAATIGPVAAACHLSGEERRYLLGAARGEGLFSCRGARMPMRVVASPREHELATTAPREVAARAAKEERATQGTDLGATAMPAPSRPPLAPRFARGAS